jgi:crossover junction endodeoxyribonuclease RuvC
MICGIDVGSWGALALLTPQGNLLEVVDMPVLRDGPKGRPAINAPLLAGLIYRWHAQQAFIELVGARPGEGAVGAFAFGRSRGVVEGVLAACSVPAAHSTPAAWKRIVGLSLASKDAARSEAVRRWPGHTALFARVKDHGRREAALIGAEGIARKGGAP